ncbi:ATP-grasp fold amidoligase family protein [Neobacillus drentensis]|uniref:ATP-grasp fold amidoligase family protein n=1 Tax=Neobacillus drentensis TaxID=220684 RepID=UPI003000F852
MTTNFFVLMVFQNSCIQRKDLEKELMKELAMTLSKDFPFGRVDLFEVEGNIYFSEMTFTPCGGIMKIEPQKYDKIWGV